MLSPRQMIPSFVLETANGVEYRSATYRGRRCLVLILPGEGEGGLVQELAAHRAEIEAEDAQVLIIGAGKSGGAGFPVLVDPEGRVRRRFDLEEQTAVYLTDPYGEIYSAYEGKELPNVEELLASLRHINAACPE